MLAAVVSGSALRPEKWLRNHSAEFITLIEDMGKLLATQEDMLLSILYLMKTVLIHKKMFSTDPSWPMLS